TLLNDEESYKYLYINNKTLDSYYKATLIGKKVKQGINGLGTYTLSEQSDISFYVMYVCCSMIVVSIKFTPVQSFIINIDILSKKNIKISADYVYEKYKSLGGNNTVAKGTNLIGEILQDQFIIQPFNP